MNDIMILFCVTVSIFCFITYAVYHGVYGSLTNANIGEVYNFYYLQPVSGTYERYLAKVIAKRDMKDYINRLNVISDYRLYDPEFVRTNTLVTCELSNGEIRNFYAERVKDCHRSIFGKLLYSIRIAHIF